MSQTTVAVLSVVNVVPYAHDKDARHSVLLRGKDIDIDIRMETPPKVDDEIMCTLEPYSANEYEDRVWETNLRALRAQWELLKTSEARAEEALEVLHTLAADLATRERPEAWADPQELEPNPPYTSERGIYYAHITLSAVIANGDLHRSGTKRPPLPEGARWTLSWGIRQKGTKDGDPVNEDIGERAFAAWQIHHNLRNHVRDVRKAYEAMLRAHLEAPS